MSKETDIPNRVILHKLSDVEALIISMKDVIERQGKKIADLEKGTRAVQKIDPLKEYEIKDLTAILKKGHCYIRELLKKHILPNRKDGKKYLVSGEDLIQYIHLHRKELISMLPDEQIPNSSRG